jgi:hypothetical protein
MEKKKKGKKKPMVDPSLLVTQKSAFAKNKSRMPSSLKKENQKTVPRSKPAETNRDF